MSRKLHKEHTAAAVDTDAVPPAEPESAPDEAPDEARSAFDRGVLWCARGAAWLVFVAMVISVYEVIMRLSLIHI